MQIRRTKIIATLGPATDAPDAMKAVMEAGTDVYRINFSHGVHEEHRKRAELVRQTARACNRQVAILADLRGPKIRIQCFGGGSVELVAGQQFTLDAARRTPGDRRGVAVSYKGLPGDVKSGDLMLLDDGLITMRVVDVQGSKVICEVEAGGVLSDRKGLNLKGGGLSLPGIAKHDVNDIALAAEIGADYLAVSFPRSAEDMQQARTLLEAAGSHAKLAAKIERTEAIDNLDEIIESSDAVLIARGDLGVEFGDAELPGLQKLITKKTLEQNRIVITATQMMQSMVENPIPTRAEVLDVANSVFDGTDAVMLSAETAVGRHPAKVVEAMNRICLGAERHADTNLDITRLNVQFERIDQAIAMAAMLTATHVSVQAIVALTESGSTAQWLSRVRTAVPIFALSHSRSSLRRMALYRGVYPVANEFPGMDVKKALTEGVRILVRNGDIMPGDRIVFTMGVLTGMKGGTNTMQLVQVGADGKLVFGPSLDPA